jgi:ATP-dependent helicase/nuclease subunit A
MSDAVGLARRFPSHRELYVAAPLGDDPDAVVLEGYVDLLIDTPDGLVIVDYKTDSVRSAAEVDAKLAAYELQGAAYAVALEITTGRTVSECRFVFCTTGPAIERAVADLAGAKARVVTAMADGADGLGRSAATLASP